MSRILCHNNPNLARWEQHYLNHRSSVAKRRSVNVGSVSFLHYKQHGAVLCLQHNFVLCSFFLIAGVQN